VHPRFATACSALAPASCPPTLSIMYMREPITNRTRPMLLCAAQATSWTLLWTRWERRCNCGALPPSSLGERERALNPWCLRSCSTEGCPVLSLSGRTQRLGRTNVTQAPSQALTLWSLAGCKRSVKRLRRRLAPTSSMAARSCTRYDRWPIVLCSTACTGLARRVLRLGVGGVQAVEDTSVFGSTMPEVRSPANHSTLDPARSSWSCAHLKGQKR
jgi:hypothetical protein